MSGHTPTPWKVCSLPASHNHVACIAAGNWIIADITKCLEWEANAAFIVEAVNSHATLLSQNAKLREALSAAELAVKALDDTGFYVDARENWSALAEPQL